MGNQTSDAPKLVISALFFFIFIYLDTFRLQK